MTSASSLEHVQHAVQTLVGRGDVDAAIACLEENLVTSADPTWILRTLTELFVASNRFDHAVACAEKLVALTPAEPANFLYLAESLLHANRPREIVARLRPIADLHPLNADLRFMIARAFQFLNEQTEAIRELTEARGLGALSSQTEQLLYQLRSQACDWDGIETQLDALFALAQSGDGALAPSTVMGAPNFDGSAHKSVARAWARAIQRSCGQTIPPRRPASAGRIRLGYISPDFQMGHPVGRHLSGVLAHHDRAKFEVIGYSLKERREKDAALYAHFDALHFGAQESDAQLAARIAGDGIEILVDLIGYAPGGRPGVLAHRPAPIQVNYMAHGGTSGADFVDYLIADPVAAPPDSAGDFTEALAYVSGSFFNCDWDRPALATTKRRYFSLPDDVFVFCASCPTVKMTPTVFDVWVDLLQQVPKSVLLLRDIAPVSKKHLVRRAGRVGVAQDRLIFAPDLLPQRYFERLSCCDLFLDTFPYTAGSTASDALWAGLPVLTMAGPSFVSRMAASIVHAAGLPGLIVSNLEDYQARAIELAYDRDLLAQHRAHLRAVREGGQFFNSAAYTRDLEGLYTRMSQRWRDGHPPDALTGPG